ncbi:MAG: GTP 3',8-cyclase MoaA [Bacillota bacterium]
MARVVELVDGFGRRITYMRVSVTDKCNLRCVYCMPEEGVKAKTHDEMLSMEEFARVVRVASALGISRVRITGGEPLARKGIVSLVRAVAAVPGIRDISMTTNATVLAPMADELARAGLNRVNISLDSLKSDTYARLTRRGDLASAIAGIHAAQRAGLRPIRLNAVVLRGINSDEIESLAALTLKHDWDVRFIEFMPFWGNGGLFGEEYVVPIGETRRRVLALGAQGPAASAQSQSGPASYLRLRGGLGQVGFISRDGDEFCGACNRIRLTADGMLRPCLLSEASIDVTAALRGGADDDAIADLIRLAVATKPESGRSRGADGGWAARPLSQIGG